MKRIIAIALIVVLAFVMFGCNVAPNIPGVTPYVTSRSNTYTTKNYNNEAINTDDALNTKQFGGTRTNVNPPDKALLPGG